MLNYQSAIEIARSVIREYSASEVLDFGEQFAVVFDIGETPLPGVSSTVLVHKKTGKADYLTIPPLENLKRLQKAPVVWTANPVISV